VSGVASEIRLERVESEEQRQAAGVLIREYLQWLNGRLEREHKIHFDVDAMIQSDFDQHKFYPPHGRFYLARYADQIAGVGCLKKLATEVGEVQRMYVAPEYRGKGIGRAIANRLIGDARSVGYRKLRLESLTFLGAAHSLYRSVGFREIDPYADNSMKAYQPSEQLGQYYSITVFMEMDL
jgi:GNAT superfamily N-acetyltransferase